MNLNELKENIKDYGRDIKLNLSSVLSEEGAPGLSSTQIWSVALAIAYTTKNPLLIEAIATEAKEKLSSEYVEAAKAASTIMAMNNIYYRFLHLSEDKEFSKMPARLRMNVIGKPGIERRDFELLCLAVSSVNGCGSCINSHIQEVKKGNITNEGVQSSIRIASVINAAAQALTIG